MGQHHPESGDDRDPGSRHGVPGPSDGGVSLPAGDNAGTNERERDEKQDAEEFPRELTAHAVLDSGPVGASAPTFPTPVRTSTPRATQKAYSYRRADADGTSVATPRKTAPPKTTASARTCSHHIASGVASVARRASTGAVMPPVSATTDIGVLPGRKSTVSGFVRPSPLAVT